MATCPNCRGGGKVSSGSACIECAGTGRVTAEAARLLSATERHYRLRRELEDAHQGEGGRASALPFREWLEAAAADERHTLRDAARELLGKGGK
jgi:RecJ-like exonuclease